ncbi:MAG: hypothetical protein ICV81_20780 [Flavisolibacter sp.]|nr:hypothetical protein [Flavisolibacter sp.]
MKLLLDEQLPVKLKDRFPAVFVTSTIKDMKWVGVKDTLLFRHIDESGFDVFITNDKSIRFQQNIHNLSFPIIDLNYFSNRYDDLLNIIEPLSNELTRLSVLILDRNKEKQGAAFIFNNNELQII